MSSVTCDEPNSLTLMVQDTTYVFYNCVYNWSYKYFTNCCYIWINKLGILVCNYDLYETKSY